VSGVLAPVFTSLACLEHDPGQGHPETTLRLPAILARLRSEPGARIINSARGSRDPLLRVHPESYLDYLESVSRRGGGRIEADTVLNGQS
jgi:acetoin utilization deacetylase AcuC-like enzyme